MILNKLLTEYTQYFEFEGIRQKDLIAEGRKSETKLLSIENESCPTTLDSAQHWLKGGVFRFLRTERVEPTRRVNPLPDPFEWPSVNFVV